MGAQVDVDGRRSFGTITDVDGRFTLESRPPSDGDHPVRITLSDPHRDDPPTTIWAHYDERTGVQVVADVRLTISGAVRPMPSDRTVETFRIVGGGTARQEDTDLHGRFTVRWLAPDTTYTFQVWDGRRGWVEVGAASTGDRNVALRRR